MSWERYRNARYNTGVYFNPIGLWAGLELSPTYSPPMTTYASLSTKDKLPLNTHHLINPHQITNSSNK